MAVRLTDEVTGRATIAGHPYADLGLTDGRTHRIVLCANCEGAHTILMLSRDRWFCTRCRNAGDARPTQVSFHFPGRRR